jgi:ribosomal protein L11 methylase PrmA
MSKKSLCSLVEHLQSGVRALRWQSDETEWSDYYDEANHSYRMMEDKKKIVSEYLDIAKPETLWDLGGNTGEYSRLASAKGIHTVSIDLDPLAVERNFIASRKNKETNLLPLIMDLINPSPGIGWESRERMSLIERGPVDMALALALIHHLAIANNVPFNKLASFFSRLCRSLIICFVPKTDAMAQKLLSSRKDIFDTYTQADFEKEFGLYFNIKASSLIPASERRIYLMENKNSI